MDPLYELLSPYFEQPDSTTSRLTPPSSTNPQTANYLNRLSKLSVADLTSTEPISLVQSAQSHLRNLQALSKRSHKAVIACTAHTSDFASLLPTIEAQSRDLQEDVPDLEAAASSFAQKYDRSTENAVLDRRKEALLLSRNSDRASDVLDLPALLSSTVAAAQTASAGSASITSTSYASALDLHSHIKRLHSLYPRSELIANISKQAEAEMQNLASILITSLQSPTLKLAGAMRTVGWLRRVAPDLADEGYKQSKPPASSSSATTRSYDRSSLHDPSNSSDGALGTLFLTCRLHTLNVTLEALEPLRELADQESSRRLSGVHAKLLRQQVSASSLGSQSERYLKRYIEIFREQSFGIVGMYRSIFPERLPGADMPTTTTTTSLSSLTTSGNVSDSNGHATINEGKADTSSSSLLPLPSPLASFSLHLVDMLAATLRAYLPNVADKSTRESLLTQVLYCAGSLSRLGAEFGLLIAMIGDEVAAENATATAAAAAASSASIPGSRGISSGGGGEVQGSGVAEDANTTKATTSTTGAAVSEAVKTDKNTLDLHGAGEDPEWVQVMLKHRVQASRLKVLARGVSSSNSTTGGGGGSGGTRKTTVDSMASPV